MRRPFLVGERVYLRGLDVEDLQGGYADWLNDAEVCRFNSHHRFPYSVEAARRYIESVNGSRAQIVLAIATRANDLHIGNVSLQNIDPISRGAEFAILLGDKAHWGQGYSREASELIVDHGFRELHLHRLYCGTDERNEGMRKLAAALGMKPEGVRRQAIFKDGAFRDVLEYGVLRDEFYARPPRQGGR